MMNFRASLILLLALVVVAMAARKTDDEEWEDFKRKQGKKYPDAAEEGKRKSLFLQVHREIEENNKSGTPWKQAHNKFSDLTPAEKAQLAGRKSTQAIAASEPLSLPVGVSDRQLPDSIDYRTDSCVGPIKNQGSCGSCWAFSAIAPLEYQLCKKRQTYISLSEQQLVNCACSGCRGGDYYPAWQYLNSTTTGSVPSTILAYTGKKAVCKSSSLGVTKPMTWGRLAANANTIKAALVSYGPLSMAMNVASSFYSYSSGVYAPRDCLNTYASLNHAMTLVGYGKDSTTALDYWVIRNSWGADWGVGGYMNVLLGVNQCGVETDVGYVTSN